MANLSTILGGGGDAAVGVEEPLPTFGVWSNYNGGTYPVSVHDSYGAPVWSGYINTDAEQWGNFNGYQYTNGSISSNSQTTYWVQATPNSQAEGHYYLDLPSVSGGYTNVMRAEWVRSNYWPYFGTVIGPSGKRQRISIYSSGTTLSIHQFASAQVASLSASSYYNASGQSGTNSYGMVSYNSRIGKLALLQANGWNYRLHVWTNPNFDLNDSGVSAYQFQQFLSQAYNGTNGASYFYNDFTWTGSNGNNESYYHLRVVMGDNGKVGLVRMDTSNQIIHVSLTPNPAGTSLSSGPTTINSAGLTTSYGIEQGWPYGIRSNINWDNSVVAAYCPYYYYASGMMVMFVNTADPSIGLRWSDTNTSWGLQLAPIGKSQFIARRAGYNVDGGNGLLLWTLDPKGQMVNGVSATSASNSASTSGTTISPMSYYLSIDTGYTSTDYPIITPMTTWVKVG